MPGRLAEVTGKTAHVSDTSTKRQPALTWDGSHLVAPAYLLGLSFAFLAQSSQQTVICLVPTFTLIPPSLISQSHTGHLLTFMLGSFGSNPASRRDHRDIALGKR